MARHVAQGKRFTMTLILPPAMPADVRKNTKHRYWLLRLHVPFPSFPFMSASTEAVSSQSQEKATQPAYRYTYYYTYVVGVSYL